RTFSGRPVNSIVAQADVADKAESVRLKSGLSPPLRETVGIVRARGCLGKTPCRQVRLAEERDAEGVLREEACRGVSFDNLLKKLNTVEYPARKGVRDAQHRTDV